MCCCVLVSDTYHTDVKEYLNKGYTSCNTHCYFHLANVPAMFLKNMKDIQMIISY